ncbi:ABC transporter substrate-binding protein [Chitinimonas lacunae]|uniref:ABC transporter substrate-binding protein n=1 Tax=Chitinimonas lacunae TaxID=1963018 RepID=A0ABV8MV61_9NEIS
MLKLGLAIALEKDATSHTKTFLQAVDYCRIVIPGLDGISIQIENDQKSVRGGRDAAAKLLKWGAQAVVGHYSSAAALGALPDYFDRGVPVLLPASTAVKLDNFGRQASRVLFRYQRSDKELIDGCIREIAASGHAGPIVFVIEEGPYGDAFAALIESSPGIFIFRFTPDDIDAKAFYVMLGHDSFVQQSVRALTRIFIRGLALLDDAYHDGALEAIKCAPGRVFTVHSKVVIKRHVSLRPFWNETVLALAAAVRLLETMGDPRRDAREIDSAMGVQKFDEKGIYAESGFVVHDLSNEVRKNRQHTYIEPTRCAETNRPRAFFMGNV